MTTTEPLSFPAWINTLPEVRDVAAEDVKAIAAALPLTDAAVMYARTEDDVKSLVWTSSKDPVQRTRLAILLRPCIGAWKLYRSRIGRAKLQAERATLKG